MTDATLDQLNRTHDAADVEGNWRAIVEEAREGDVVVTSDNEPEVVVISVERYVELKNAARANALQRLREKFDRELAVLNEPGGTEKLNEIFNATPEEIAAAANRARLRNK